MPLLRCTLLLLPLALLVPLASTKSSRIGIAGPFRLIPGHVEDCPAELLPKVPLDMHWLGVRDRVNVNLWYYWANFTSRFTFDDTHSANINMASWSSRGGWKDNAFLFNFPKVCTFMRTGSPKMWRTLMVALHDDPNAFCPFPPGKYYMRNASTDFDLHIVPAFFYGKWRVTLRMLRTEDKETVGCLRVFGETVPRLKPANG